MDIAAYLDEIRAIHATGVASEHSYRPALAKLFNTIDPDLDVINEPKKIEVGAPDFIFQRDGVARGWCEHKDIDKDVVKPKGYSREQKERYTEGLPNLIYTNGLDFEFLRDGEQTAFVTIADFAPGLPANPDQFDRLETLLKTFAAAKPVTITSARRLAELMAGKAKLIKQALAGVLKNDPDFQSELGAQYKSFKANLLPNLTPGEFADIYAETVTYGMFAARFHDQTPDTFSRGEALELLPKTNPFLRSMFQFVAGYDLDERIAWIVDDLADLLQAANVHDLFADYGKWDARNDPFIHFYEDFLGAYNPKKKKSRGVWYTPEPVVDFITRAVDDVLKSEFGLADGLADTSKVTVNWDTGQTDKKGKAVTIKRDVHRVQILDPATGTGTFLAKVVQVISDRVKGRAPGLWSSYVARDLLPRLHGFELLMASYAMCHMKLDMQLTESGYVPSDGPPPADWPADRQWPPRLSVWLTNALEPAERDMADLFMPALAKEAKGAAEVKRQTPIMCVIGNPPYSGISQNMDNEFINNLIEDYKYVDGVHFGERKHWLHDDYVKFIRMSEELIAKNPSGGVLGFITNHGYLDNPTFRGMRWHLLKTFDKIWVLDLHGNAKKKEVSPDGSPDKNVFDIQQGVAIIIAVRKGTNHPHPNPSPKGEGRNLAQVWHGDLWGSRKAKGEWLFTNNLEPNLFVSHNPISQNFLFDNRSSRSAGIYEAGISVPALFGDSVTGVQTSRDHLVVDQDRLNLLTKLSAFADPQISLAQARSNFFPEKPSSKYPRGDTRGWKVEEARSFLQSNSPDNIIIQYDYRPFDRQFIAYHSELVDWPRTKVMRNFERSNLGLSLGRQGQAVGQMLWNVVLAHSAVSDLNLFYRGGGMSFPLYLYPDENAEQGDAFAPTTRTLNFDPKLYAKICKAAGIDPVDTDMARQGDTPPSPSGEGQRDLSSSRKADAMSRSGVGDKGMEQRQPGIPPSQPSPLKEGGPPGFRPKSFREATGDARPSEVKIFDYIYGVLHSPDYRETFAEFLKIDFPRIPWPTSPEVFAHISEKGEALRRLHLMEEAAIGDTPYPFMPADLTDLAQEERDIVAATYPKWKDGRVYINKVQYFDDVPKAVWDFYIGGYQPAQKWLKDRKGRTLSYDDIVHYQRIVKILTETGRIMGEIELPLEPDQ